MNKKTQNNHPTFKKTALASAIILAIAPTWTTAHENKWKTNVELFITPGDNRTIIGAALLIPIRQTENQMTYLDLRGNVTDQSTNEYNAGIGHRWFNPTGDRIYGAFAAYDRRRNSTGNHFTQMTIGAETMGIRWDFRANYYHPTTNKQLIDISDTGGLGSGHSFFRGGIYEEAMKGLDIEVGYHFKDIPWETRIALAAYTFEADIAPTATGGRIRIETRPRQNIILGLLYQDDNVFDSETRAEVRYSFGYDGSKGHRTIRERMIELPYRDIDIKDTSELPTKDKVGNPEFDITGGNAYYFDKDNEEANRDGTAENPYRRSADC